jgi:3-phenylpropionate/trans-cinnamate dioxygenase ferredoxin reductase component
MARMLIEKGNRMRIVIIGAGECGTRAALALREQGFDGSIDLVNGETHLPYERPSLSKPSADGIVLKAISGTDGVLAANITMHQGVTAKALDRDAKQVELSNGDHLSYDKLVLATGARPRPLVLDGHPVPQARYLRTYDEARSFFDALGAHTRLAVIGGGFIGLEVAAEARKRGAPVTVLEAAPRLLGRAVPASLAKRIEERHRAENVAFHIGKAIVSIGPYQSITLADGTEVACDLLLAGIGSLPNIELAEAAGLVIENGIAVDGQLQTSDPDIYAAGDCCSFPHPLYAGQRIRIESWRAAQEQGDHVAKSILGATDAYQAVPWFWSDQYDLTLQIAGLATGAVTEVERPISDDAALLFHLHEDGRLLAASGLGVGNSVAKDIRVAEMLIAKQAKPDPALLADPAFKLKSLLAAGP